MLDATSGYLVQTAPEPGSSSGPAPEGVPPPYQLRLPKNVLDRLLQAQAEGQALSIEPPDARSSGALLIGSDTFSLSDPVEQPPYSLFQSHPAWGSNTNPSLQLVGPLKMLHVKPPFDTRGMSMIREKRDMEKRRGQMAILMDDPLSDKMHETKPQSGTKPPTRPSSRPGSRPQSTERGRSSNLLDATALAKRAASRGHTRSASPLVSASPARALGAAGSPLKPVNSDHTSRAEGSVSPKFSPGPRDVPGDPQGVRGVKRPPSVKPSGPSSPPPPNQDAGTGSISSTAHSSDLPRQPQSQDEMLQEQIIHMLAPGPMTRRNIVQHLSFFSPVSSSPDTAQEETRSPIPEPKILQALTKVAHAPAELQQHTPESGRFQGPLNRRNFQPPFRADQRPGQGPSSVWDLLPIVRLHQIHLDWPGWDVRTRRQVVWSIDDELHRSLRPGSAEWRAVLSRIWPEGEPSASERSAHRRSLESTERNGSPPNDPAGAEVDMDLNDDQPVAPAAFASVQTKSTPAADLVNLPNQPGGEGEEDHDLHGKAKDGETEQRREGERDPPHSANKKRSRELVEHKENSPRAKMDDIPSKRRRAEEETTRKKPRTTEELGTKRRRPSELISSTPGAKAEDVSRKGKSPEDVSRKGKVADNAPRKAKGEEDVSRKAYSNNELTRGTHIEDPPKRSRRLDESTAKRSSNGESSGRTSKDKEDDLNLDSSLARGPSSSKDKRAKQRRSIDYTDSSRSDSASPRLGDIKQRRLVAQYDKLASEYQSEVSELTRLRPRLEHMQSRMVQATDWVSSGRSMEEAHALLRSKVPDEVNALVAEQQRRLDRLARIQHQIDALNPDDSM